MDRSISVANRAKLSILGAIIGDALGATLEFKTTKQATQITEKLDYFANGLVGDGPFDLVPGQFTDDTEMALAIMYVINKDGEYNQNRVAKMYHFWYLSDPFDMGVTTRTAVSNATAQKMLVASKKYNSNSLSNGFLMRLFGLVCMYYNKGIGELREAMVLDVALTHSHPETFEIAVVYGTMLWKAIRGESAEMIYAWGKKNCGKSKLFIAVYKATDSNNTEFVYDGKKYAFAQIDSLMCGFVGFAIWLLLRALKSSKSYQATMIEIVSRGGDTDTNACIVGPIMAALYPTTIPKKWISSVINCNATGRYRKYPIANPSIWLEWLP